MMQFRAPSFDEYADYTHYYKQCLQLSAECSFLALWSYQEELQLERAFCHDLYWHKARWHDQAIWLPPIGEWDRSDWEELLTAAVPPGTLFGFVPEFLANKWVKSFPDKLAVDGMREEWDYIYHMDQQVFLEGQAFASMRTACRKFIKSYPYEFSEITPDDIPAIIAFQHQWMEGKKNDGKINEDLAAEHRTVLRVLENWPMLRAVHGAKFTVDKEVVAYIVVEELDDYIISGHILKGNYSYKGVYQAMQHLLYKSKLANFSIINAWGDGGSEGLRQAKLNLNPIGYIKKYLITWKG